MAIENTASSDFDPHSSIVKSVFDCRLPGVMKMWTITIYNSYSTVLYVYLYSSNAELASTSCKQTFLLKRKCTQGNKQSSHGLI